MINLTIKRMRIVTLPMKRDQTVLKDMTGSLLMQRI